MGVGWDGAAPRILFDPKILCFLCLDTWWNNTSKLATVSWKKTSVNWFCAYYLLETWTENLKYIITQMKKNVS